MNTSEVSAQARFIADYDKSKYETYGGVDFAEIEVDTELGTDSRQAIPGRCTTAAGRIESLAGHRTGSTAVLIQGMSYALYERSDCWTRTTA